MTVKYQVMIVRLIKYANDTVLTGFLNDNDSYGFGAEVQKFVDWCQGNSLILNIRKSKEVVCKLRKCNFIHNRLVG